MVIFNFVTLDLSFVDQAMKRHFTIRVSGKVQGVFYRASAAETAKQLGLTGMVKNEPDGNVYIEAEGEEASLQKFVAWAKSGPPRARVETCEVVEGELKDYLEFKIER